MLPSRRDARSSSEYPKTLDSWLELDYFRRPRPLRRVRSLAAKLVLLACVVLLAAVALLPGSRRIYQAAPVSTAHAIFNDDCEACHTVRFATATRLVRNDDTLRSVSDEACLRCHAGDVHSPRQTTTPGCAGCHREHRDRGELARVADGHCTSCHGDLRGHANPSGPADPDRTIRDVLAFVGGSRPHPPFAVSGDPGTIRFNHRVHMDAKGLLVPGTLERKALRCDDCHRPDAAGRYMQPIRYRANCAGCHPLSVQVFDTSLEAAAREEADRFRKLPAPHPDAEETGETVRAVLRDRYLEFARRFPSVYAGQARPEMPSPLLGRRRPDPTSTVRFESEWAERQVAEAGRTLFDGAGGCRYCHAEKSDAGSGPGRLPRWEPSKIPARWMPRSVFSHDSHRALDCLQCHAGASESAESGDVLMPAIESCRACHAGGGRGARADCVECHLYHAPGKPRGAFRDLAIDDFLKGHGARARPEALRQAGPSPTR